jgi:hypothetical protein
MAATHKTGCPCGAGGAAGEAGFLCSQCKQVRFCSKDCQRAQWAAHKPRCVAAWAALEEARLDATAAALKTRADAAPPDPPPRAGSICRVISAVRAEAGQAAMAAWAFKSFAADLAQCVPREDGAVWCVRVPPGDSVSATAFTLPAGDATLSRGDLSPVLSMCGIPLAVVRSVAGLQRQRRAAGLDNQRATYFMIDSGTGFAPDEWQWNVGEIILVRRDKKPITQSHFAVLWDFLNCILDGFGEDDGGRGARAMMSPAGFKAWLKKRYGEGGGEQKLPW